MELHCDACLRTIVSLLLAIHLPPSPFTVGLRRSPSSSSRVLRVSTIQIEPYVMFEGSSGKPNVSFNYHTKPKFKGFIPDLLEELSVETGFEFDLNLVKEGSYGFRNNDGTWDGLIGEIMTGVADFGAAPLHITNRRKQVVDFSEPFMTVHATLLFRKPPQGAAALHIRSIHDLTRQREIAYGTLDHGLIIRAFRNTNDSTLVKMWRKMNQDRSLLTRSNEDGVERVRTEKYAFILPDTIGEYLSLRPPCDLMTVDHFLINEHYALALPKDSRYKNQLNIGLRRLQATGALARLRHKWWQGQDECQMTAHTSRMYSHDQGISLSSSGALLLSSLALLACL
ncbi:hypothetical protein CAPTEDRAFT_147793 [Capitella teleta]|uniref:Ionotropic glutamate receptor L-glutamate and glycine-binding domain-containing protein n=1 Tax=Capitella teleta TaxID=283909 RepID=X1Z503_CAPTE|nr:hypothetical protein CAPTEDRAFT_147793 [Capitella teleta]|eukprot:ELT90099.1 hypothetical protein CAPTEDRAFT_147793 [Capitella teleta]